MLIISEELKQAYSGGNIGILVLSDVINYEISSELEKEKENLEESLRTKFKSYDRSKLSSIEPISTYIEYYKRFKKTYHVLLQLESIVFKKKSIPKVSTLVEIMFMAELKNQLLTAGHDLAMLELPLRAELATGEEIYKILNGQEKTLAAGDMLLADKQGIISSIIYGPDQRTPITKKTEKVVFTVYAPPGISRSLVLDHLTDIHNYSKVVSPETKVDLKEVFAL